MAGKVYLVGAGPGDPGLITVKGLRILQQADVVVYDRLLDPALLHAAPERAERVFVGKARGQQAMTQDEINQLLVNCAQAGKTVVRLKGGDPYVFGRGGEEALALAQHGISFEVVPGITSAIGGAAYAGIPVTHRGVATCFTVVSGSEDPTKPESGVPWDVLARTRGTLVILMGWNAIQSILNTLQGHGMAPDTPVALVQWGTWPRQRTVIATLADAAHKGQEAGLTPPVIAIVGPVVNLREQIAWFDRRPLSGKRVLITRARTQASRLRELLTELGAEAVELPTIEIAPLEDYTRLDAALARLNTFRWIILNSVNAVDAVFARLKAMGRDSRSFGNTRIAAIGPATADALARWGLTVDFMPTRSVSEEASQELARLQDWTAVTVLIPAADIGRDVIARQLASQRAIVEQITAYRTVTPPDIRERAQAIFKDGVDVVTFTSSSTVRNLLDILGDDRAALDSTLTACIGPITEATARELGLRVDLVAQEHNVEGLVEALVQHYDYVEQIKQVN